MIINKLTPQGFCGGVNKALKTLDEAINNPNTIKPIYLLGSIIHNEHIINEYKEKGVILIDNKNKTRLELLDEISFGTVVFSAHGVSPDVYKKAKNLDELKVKAPTLIKINGEKISAYYEGDEIKDKLK
jgi:4-hydroxy-3-methylbut-2-enyl diphosphate reductase